MLNIPDSKFNIGEEVILWPLDPYHRARGEVVTIIKSGYSATIIGGTGLIELAWIYWVNPNVWNDNLPLWEGILRPKPKGNGL